MIWELWLIPWKNIKLDPYLILYTKINSKWIKILNYKNEAILSKAKNPPNNPIQKWAKDLNRHFSKEDMQIANKLMKRCSISFVIREMQVRTTVRYCFRMAVINKQTNRK